MSKSTRYFLIGAATVVVLGVGTGLVAYYNGGLPGARQTSDADLAYLPANAAAVGYADVRTIMSSSSGRSFARSCRPAKKGQAAGRAWCGPRARYRLGRCGLLRWVFALRWGIVVVRGRFNTSQIEALATQHGATASDYKGRRLLTMAAENHEVSAEGASATSHHPSAGVAFLEQGVVAFGDASGLKLAIDSAETGDDIRKNADLIERRE